MKICLQTFVDEYGYGIKDKIKEKIRLAYCRNYNRLFVFLFFITIYMLLMCDKTLATDYIYFDLYYGNITITETSYSGYTFSGEVQTGTHDDNNYYYIFQSRGESNLTEVPNYDRVQYNDSMSWGEYITNHPIRSTISDKADSVDEVISSWGAVTKLNSTNVSTTGVAIKAGRKPVPYYILIEGGGTYNVVIDDIWSSYQTTLSAAEQNKGRKDLGGIVYIPTDLNTTLNLFIEGDNRFGNIHAATHDGKNGKYEFDTEHTNKIVIKEYTKGNDATLTLCNLMINKGTNSTASCIGGTDNWDHSAKIIIEGGIIYAGSAKDDFCTAIGGGGNGDGRVIIKGGTITAIHSSTGTAIGGGCGTSGPGGYGNVTIEDGEVYAYSYAVSYGSVTTYNQSLPTAIGGGSSGIQVGGTGIVNITGGKVYAYSKKGNAIGAGGGGIGLNKSTYYSATGGVADVKISGGEIIAISDQGCAIGGGPGGGSQYKSYANISKTNLPPDNLSKDENGTITGVVDASGGEANLTITGGNIKTGSIGGGSPILETSTNENKYGFTIGAAKVYISGGTTHGQVVMEGLGSVFEMTDGLIDNESIGSEYKFVKNNGGAVYIKTGNATLSGGTIKNATSNNGGAISLTGGSFELSGTGKIENCTAENGGAVYVSDGNVTISGGTIENCIASETGGALSIVGGEFLMTGGQIGNINGNEKIGNKAVKGGAAYISGGDFTMDGGTIEGNTATESGGAIQISDGNVYITDGKISSNVARGETSETGYGGGIFVDGGEKVSITGGEISNNVAAKNGGGIEVKTVKIVIVDIYSGTFIDNVADEYGGAVGIECDNGTINVGKQECDGIDESHKHPIISGNLAGIQGGGFYMSGQNAQLNIYCGIIDNNIVVNIENNFDQSNGTVTVYEGVQIGDENEGIIVVGGTFEDKRKQDEEKYTIIYYSNYEGIIESNEATVTKGSLITLPGNIFGVEGYSILGWTTSKEDQNEIEYKVGEVIEITENLEIYAIWIEEEENAPSFVIIIPAEINFGNTETIVFDVSATIKLFPRDKVLVVNLENTDFCLKLYEEEEEKDALEYVITKRGEEIGNGDNILRAYSDSALITYEVEEELKLKLIETPIYGGVYEDTLTFSASVEDVI